MNNLEIENLRELNTQEMKETNGGSILLALALLAFLWGVGTGLSNGNYIESAE